MEARLPLAAALPAIGAAVGIGSSIYQDVNKGNAANSASQAQQNAYQQAAANLSPWMNAGQTALNQQLALLGLGGSGLPGGASSATPNYAAYVTGNPDILAAYQAGDGKGASIEDFGKWHWQTFGQNEVNSGDPNRPLTPFGPASSLNGGAAGGQQSAIDALKNGPLYQSLYHNGEQSILANAAATGGLRGGNTQRSLYNLGTDTLASVYQNQLDNLNRISVAGQNSAAGVGTAQIGAGQAQGLGIIGSANANNDLAKTIAGIPSAFGNSSVLNGLGINNGGVTAIPGITSSSFGGSFGGGPTIDPGSLVF
jgi:hypothetical protein